MSLPSGRLQQFMVVLFKRLPHLDLKFKRLPPHSFPKDIFMCVCMHVILLGKPTQQETCLLFVAEHKETPWLTVYKLACIFMAELLVSVVFLDLPIDRMKANRYKL